MVDGFESSASKASLKEKYGHTKIATAIAPPPIFGAPQVGASSTLGPPNLYQNTQGTQPPYLLNRYVPYDPNIPPVPYAQPNYPPVYQQSSFPTANQSESSFVPPPVYSTFPPPQPAATIPAPIQTTETTGSIPSTRLTNSPRIHVNADNVFNPVTDRVVSATSSSSAIL